MGLLIYFSDVIIIFFFIVAFYYNVIKILEGIIGIGICSTSIILLTNDIIKDKKQSKITVN